MNSGDMLITSLSLDFESHKFFTSEKTIETIFQYFEETNESSLGSNVSSNCTLHIWFFVGHTWNQRSSGRKWKTWWTSKLHVIFFITHKPEELINCKNLLIIKFGIFSCHGVWILTFSCEIFINKTEKWFNHNDYIVWILP